VDVAAAGVGFFDLLVTKGEYQIKPELPCAPATECVGVRRDTGERVVATAMFSALAEVTNAVPFATFAIGDAFTDAEAAAFLINYQTAHLALVPRGRLAPGETVLVLGAAGGVGTAAIQVAKAIGAGSVIAAASTEEKRAAALAAGADHAVDAHDFIGAVKELGGAEVNRLLLKHLDVIGVNWGGMLPFDTAFAATAHDDLMRWHGEGHIRPVVGPVYPLAEGAQAYRDLETRMVIGKPVVTMT